jgi:hypothetical protein
MEKEIRTQIITDQHRLLGVKKLPSVFIRVYLCPIGFEVELATKGKKVRTRMNADEHRL